MYGLWEGNSGINDESTKCYMENKYVGFDSNGNIFMQQNGHNLLTGSTNKHYLQEKVIPEKNENIWHLFLS